MKILISFVNQVLTPDLKLGIIDTNTEEFTWIKNGIEEFGEGATGILVYNDKIYVCMQQSKLVVYDYNFNIFQIYNFKYVKDAHSLIHYQNGIYVVSSGTNEVYKLYYDDLGNIEHEELFWCVENLIDYKKDYVHLNSIAVIDNEIYVTMFGNKNETGSWSDDGKLINIRNEEIVKNIQQPHTSYNYKEEIIYCESRTGLLKNSKAEILISLDGYIRGITECSHYLYVASSSRRKISKSKKKFLKGRMGGKEDVLTKCQINIVNKNNMLLNKTIDMSDYANEIYDLYMMPQNIGFDFKFDKLQVLRQINMSTEKAFLDKIFSHEQEVSRTEEEQQTRIEIREKNIEKYKNQVENRNNDIEKYKTQVENRNNNIEKYKQIITTYQNTISNIKNKVKEIQSVNLPLKKYKAYLKLIKVINEIKS